jgi:streptogramin lyase
MYHASGISDGSEYFEPIDLITLTMGANLAPGNTWPAGLTEEVTGMVYYPPLNGFVVMDRDVNIALIDPVTDNFSFLSSYSGSYIRGFAVVGTSIYGVDPFSSDLIEFNPITGAVVSTVPVVMDGSTITAGSLGLTTDPSTGDVYIIYKSGGSNRSLGIIDVTTGIGTGIGVTGVNFSSISFDASGNLYAVSGDGASPPETLFKFDESAGGGNTATCTFTVTVNDTEDPLIACPADITVSNDPGTCEAIIADLGTPALSDNCPRAIAAFNDAFVPAGSSSLIAPYAAVFGPDGNLYVTSRGTAEILRYDGTTGAFMDDFVTAGNGGLDGPIGLVFGPNGNLYVTSIATDEILRYNGITGDIIDAFVFAGDGGLYEPRGLVFGPDGNLYVTSATNEILRYDGTTGAFMDAFVTANDGGLFFPGDLVFGPDANLYVGSYLTGQVLRYDGLTGTFINDFVFAGDGGLDGPTGLAFGPDGNLYVASDFTSGILRYDGTTGAFIDDFVSGGIGGLIAPRGLVFDPDGNLYVASLGTNRILRYDFGYSFPVGSTTITWTATDAAGNTATCEQTVTVNDTEAPVITCPEDITVSNDQGTCDDDAVVTWTAPTGADNCFGFVVTSTHEPGDAFPLGTTEVTYTVTDAAGLTAECSFNVTVVNIIIEKIITDVSCFGGSDGSVDITATGGTPPYTYSWTGPGYFYSTSEDLSGLEAGTYEVTVTDSTGGSYGYGGGDGCSSSMTVVIGQPDAIVIDKIITDVSCFGGSDGSVDITVSEGTPPYTYAWSGPGYFSATTEDLSDLEAGTYEVTVTDSSGDGGAYGYGGGGCTNSITITIDQPPALSATIDSQVDVACFGESTGSVVITPAGGTPSESATFIETYCFPGAPYSGDSQPTVSVVLPALPSGAAVSSATLNLDSLTSTNSWLSEIGVELSGAYSTGGAIIPVPGINGPGSQNVNIPLAAFPVTGGTINFDFIWFGPGSGNDVDLQSACIEIEYTIPLTNLNTGGYTITPAQTDLAAGDYTFTVEDANGCTTTVDVTIAQPAIAVSVSGVATNASCFGESDGSIAIANSAGSTVVITDSNDVDVSADNGSLPAGVYTLTATADGGNTGDECEAIATITIEEPDPITNTVNAINASCFADDGSIDITVTGGTAPYTYDWSGPGYFSASTEDLSDLEAGTYEVTVTDSSGDGGAYGYGGGGCTNTITVTIGQLDPIVIDTLIEDVSCLGGSDGSIDITVTGGTDPYTYAWTGPGYFSADTEDLTDLEAGTYEVTVTDANGCTASFEATIYEPVYGSSTALNIKVFLGGPYATGTGTMNYDLSYNGQTPTDCPYIDEATCHTSVFNTSGNDAIVDWVWLELRDGTDAITVIEAKSALIQADGDVVGTDGVSPVSFDVASANYYVMVSHRNHLGVLTANPISITVCNVTNVDLTTNINMIYGGTNGAQISEDGRIVLYPGDCNGDGQIQNTDKNEASPLRGLSGYINADVDMNGEVQNSDINSYLNPNIGKGIQTGGSRSANLSLYAKRKVN